MKRAILFLMLWASSVAIVGCSSINTAIRDVEIKDYNDPMIDFSFKSHASHLKIIDSDATRRITYVRTRGEPNFVIVAEPPPDAAVSYMNALQGTVQGLKGTATNADFNSLFSASVIELTRSREIQTLREAFYRLDEMYFNGAIDGPTSAHLYDELIDAAKEIGLAEANAISQSNVNEIKATIKEMQADINDLKKSCAAEHKP